jgi:hypothetical protein
MSVSKESKPLTLARLNDLTLGSFAFVPNSETLNHLLRYLGTWSGSELRIISLCPGCTKFLRRAPTASYSWSVFTRNDQSG